MKVNKAASVAALWPLLDLSLPDETQKHGKDDIGTGNHLAMWPLLKPYRDSAHQHDALPSCGRLIPSHKDGKGRHPWPGFVPDSHHSGFCEDTGVWWPLLKASMSGRHHFAKWEPFHIFDIDLLPYASDIKVGLYGGFVPSAYRKIACPVLEADCSVSKCLLCSEQVLGLNGKSNEEHRQRPVWNGWPPIWVVPVVASAFAALPSCCDNITKQIQSKGVTSWR